jgi:hypothetical protein
MLGSSSSRSASLTLFRFLPARPNKEIAKDFGFAGAISRTDGIGRKVGIFSNGAFFSEPSYFRQKVPFVEASKIGH